MTCFDDLKCFIEFVAGHAIMIETLHHFLHIAVANTQFGSKGIPFSAADWDPLIPLW